MQIVISVSTFLALVASSAALQVTSPAEGSTIDVSKGNKIEWATVSSDPTKFNIVVTNNNVNPPVEVTIAKDVSTADGSYEIKKVEGIAPGGNYRINLESSSALNSGILAQSGQFEISESGGETSLASFSSSTPSGVTQTQSTATSTSESSSETTTDESASASASETASETDSSASATDSESASGTSSATATASTEANGATALTAFGGLSALTLFAVLFA